VGYTFGLNQEPIAYSTYYKSTDENIYFELFYGGKMFEFKTDAHHRFLTSFVTNDNQLVIYSDEGIAVLNLNALDPSEKVVFSKKNQDPSLIEIKPFSDEFDSDPTLIREFLQAIYNTSEKAEVPGQLTFIGTHSPFYTFDHNESRTIFCFYKSGLEVKVHFFRDVRREFQRDLISAFIKPGLEKQYLVWVSENFQKREMELNLCTFSELNDQTFSWLESILIKPKQTIEPVTTILPERTIEPVTTILPERTIEPDSTILSKRNLFLFSLFVLLFISVGVYMSWSPSTSSGKNKSPVIASRASKKKKSKRGTLAASAFRSTKKKRTKIV